MHATPEITVQADGVHLRGAWTLASMGAHWAQLAAAVQQAASNNPHRPWHLHEVTVLDSAAACLLWRVWGQQWPMLPDLPPLLRDVLQRVSQVDTQIPSPDTPRATLLHELGNLAFQVLRHWRSLIELIGQLWLDFFYLCRNPKEFPWREFSANIYHAGARALPVSALVGFLIGVTISYLSALQLKSFGADLFIVNLLGIGILRELGPVLVAILVAGRSGSAMTAQIGVMRVTEEIDALVTLGISRSQRLVLAKVAALSVAMPLLVIWSSAAAMLGGMLAAYAQLDISLVYFANALPSAVPYANLLIGLGKGFVFGFWIALLACHFGLHVKPNTESLSRGTTTSVVAAITLVILIDAIFAVATRSIGIPGGLK